MTDLEVDVYRNRNSSTSVKAKEIVELQLPNEHDLDFEEEPQPKSTERVPEDHETGENPAQAATKSSHPEQPKISQPHYKVTVVEEDQDMLEYETGMLDDLDDEDDVITFAAPMPPVVIAKPIQISESATASCPSSSPTSGSGRLRSLSMNGHLTLNLQPQMSSSPASPSSRTDSSSPTMGRFTVTTCQSEGGNNSSSSQHRNSSPPGKDSKDSVPPPESEPPQPSPAPQPKDERLLTPIERLQMYAEKADMVCRNGVALQFVNFLKEAEDSEVFLTLSIPYIAKFMQEQELTMRMAFLEQVPNIVRTYRPSFKKLRLMGFLGESIRDDNYNIRRLAQVAIGQLVEFAPELMTRETITASVVPLLIQIFFAESPADLIIDALNLFCKLLDKVGPDPVKRLFIPEYSKLCTHDIAQIRQVCAQNLAFVVRYFAVTQAEEFQEDDDYCRIIQDKIQQLAGDFAWHVRETVANVFPQVVDICHKRWPVYSAKSLYTIYMSLLNDQAKQVRRSAARGLGRVIAASADPSKTRLQITSSGTVEFIPPSTFPAYRLSDSEDSNDRRMNPSLSDGTLLDAGREGKNFRPGHRQLGSTASSPAVNSQNSGHPRRNYYNRLGIVTSLSQSLSEADEGHDAVKNEPSDFNSFRFWNNPILAVAVSDDKVPILLQETVTEKAEDFAYPVEVVEEKDLQAELDASFCETPEVVTDGAETIESQKMLNGEKLALVSSMEHVVLSPEAEELPLESSEILQEMEVIDSATDEHEGQPPIENKTTASNNISVAQSNVASALMDFNRHLAEKLEASISDQNHVKEGKVAEKLSPGTDSDETHSVSSTSSASQDLTGNLTSVNTPPSMPFATAYEIDSAIINKHKQRDRAVMMQLKEKGEIASRMEDILPNVQFLKEFLALTKDSDREAVIQVAVDFPAVAFTLGRQFWPDIQEYHRALAGSNVVQARELIAASMPRIAEIVGYYYSVVDLVPLLNEFLKDTDSVRLAMIENYSTFIMRLPPEVRPMHLLRLCEFFSPDEERNWRYRYTCAEQIAHLAQLFPPKLVVRSLMDGAWFFARDRTAEVRKHSCIALSAIFAKIEQQRDHHSRNIFLKKLELFLRNEDFRFRQVFAQICEDLLAKAALSFDSFSLFFGDRFWPLFDDHVVAVRLAAARALTHIPHLSRRQSQFARALEKLQKDQSRTIQEVYQNIMTAGAMTVAIT